MTVLLFLAFLAAALGVGGWLSVRSHRPPDSDVASYVVSIPADAWKDTK